MFRYLCGMKGRITPEYIKHHELKPEQIFVFGSNLSGRHGKGAAKDAMGWGAVWGQAAGLQGRTYGIPTKGHSMKHILSVTEIKKFVDEFVVFAKANPQMVFCVTEIGCGYSHYEPKHMAPLFKACVELDNVWLPARFWHKLPKQEQPPLF